LHEHIKDENLAELMSIFEAELLKALYSQANVYYFEHGGHLTLSFFPEEWTTAVEDFLKDYQ